MIDLIVTKFKTYLNTFLEALELILIVSAFFYGQHVQKLEDNSDLDKANVEFQKKVDTEVNRRKLIEETFESKLDNIQIINKTINTKVQKEIQKEVYTDCKIPQSGIDLLNDSINKNNDTRKGGVK